MTSVWMPSFEASSTVLSRAMRATFSGTGSMGVSSSCTPVVSSPPASVATMLEPLVWMKCLPEPLSAASSASTAVRSSGDAPLMTASDSFASLASTARSSKDATVAWMPRASSARALSCVRAVPTT